METPTQSTNITNTCTTCDCSHDNKKAIGKLLSIGGVIFMLAGIMFFISLMCLIYLQRDIVTAFIIGSLIVGVASLSVGSFLVTKK